MKTRRHELGNALGKAALAIAEDDRDFAASLRHSCELLTLDPGNAQLLALVAEVEKKARP